MYFDSLFQRCLDPCPLRINGILNRRFDCLTTGNAPGQVRVTDHISALVRIFNKTPQNNPKHHFPQKKSCRFGFQAGTGNSIGTSRDPSLKQASKRRDATPRPYDSLKFLTISAKSDAVACWRVARSATESTAPEMLPTASVTSVLWAAVSWTPSAMFWTAELT